MIRFVGIGEFIVSTPPFAWGGGWVSPEIEVDTSHWGGGDLLGMGF